MNDVLNIIFTMLMSFNNCNYTDSMHTMMLPENILYHTYEYKGDIVLTPHEEYKSFQIQLIYYICMIVFIQN